jgi:primosomal replication protein N
LQAAVADNIRPLLQQVICDRVHRFINVDLNEKLSATPSKSPLSAATEMSIFNLALKKGEQSPINGAIVPLIRSHRSKRQSSSVLRRTVVTVAAVNNKQRKKKEKTKMVHSSKVHSVGSATRHTSAAASSKLNLTELFGPV